MRPCSVTVPYCLGSASISDEEYEEFLAQHYPDRREGTA